MRLAVVCSAALALVSAWGWSRGAGPEELRRQRRQLADFWPVLAAALSAGVTGGLVRRDGVVSGAGYSSPLQAWIGKRAALAGFVFVSAWWLSPLGAEGRLLWVAAGCLLGGAWAYVGNLPGRL